MDNEILIDNLEEIQRQKNLYLLPENIKEGVNIFGIVGSYAPSGGKQEKDINFYDYDGTLIDSYTKADFLELSEMPANPSHTGLLAEGWNWTLAQAQNYLTYYDKLNIGQMYTTTSGNTEFDITLNKATGLTFTLNMAGTKDWGDGTTDSATSHTYASEGSYTITCDGNAISSSLIFGQTSNKRNGSVTSARIVNITTLYESSFDYCPSLQTIIISPDVTTIGNYQFREAKWLKFLVIPNTITSVPQYMCYNNNSLEGVIIPPSVTTINQYAFAYCTRLKKVTLPIETVTFQSGYTFQNCYNLSEINLSPNIGYLTQQCLANCAFRKLDFSKFTQIPTYGTSATTGLSKLAPIIVPDSLYSSWISYAGWSSYSSFIVRASDV